MKLIIDIDENGENIQGIVIKKEEDNDTNSFYSDNSSETDTEPDLDLLLEENNEMKVEIEKLNEKIRKLKVLLDL